MEIKDLIDDWAKSVFIAGPDHQFLKYALAVNMREKLFQLYDMTGKCAEIEDVDNATSSRYSFNPSSQEYDQGWKKK